MKIAVLSSFPPRKCGIAHLTRNLFDELRAQGHELVTFGVEGSESDYILDTKSLLGLRKVVEVIDREKIQYVSVQFIIGFFGKKYFGLNFLIFLWMLRRRHVRVIVTLHELHHIRSLGHALSHPADLVHIALEVLIACFSTGVILHTEAQAANLRKYGVKNVRAVYLGIQTKNVPRTRTVLNKALFFGKLVPIKGVHLFPGIALASPEVHFTLACSTEPQFDAYRMELEKSFEGIPNITFITKEWIGDAEKDAYFAEADVLVLPYVNAYYQSGVASESGVYNIPIVIPRLGPLSEIPDKYHAGESVASPSPEEIREAIRKIFANYPRYLEGIHRYREDANWSVAAAKYVNYLRG